MFRKIKGYKNLMENKLNNAYDSKLKKYRKKVIYIQRESKESAECDQAELKWARMVLEINR